MHRRCSIVVVTLTLGALLAPANAQQRVPEADYAKWETLANSAISPDGRWVAYDLRRNNGVGELHYRAVASEPDHTVRLASSPTFTSNSRWLIYTISPDTMAAGRGGRGRGGAGAGGANTPAPRNKVAVVDLTTNTTTVLEDVQSYVASSNGTHVAFRRYVPTGRQSRGADLVVRDLAKGADITLGNVADFAWSDDGALLAMTIDVEGKTGNGVQVLTAATGVMRSLDAGDASFVNLRWREKSDDLVAMRSRLDSAFVDTSFTVIAWRGVGGSSPSEHVYDFSADRSFPREMRVASYRLPQWSEDGSIVFFGVAPRDPKEPPAARGTIQPARVEVWHWKDLRQYHMQNRQSQADRQRAQLVAWHLSPNTLVRLGQDFSEIVQLSDNRRAAIALDDGPYFTESISGRPYRDVYRIDVSSGKRDKIITKAPFGASFSPSGRYLVYGQSGHWWSYDLTNGTRTNLTAKIRGTFVNMEDDHPVPDRRPYGMARWITGEQAVVLYDRFDLWQVTPDGATATRLTRGKEDSTVYRYVALDADERTIDPAKPMMLSATGEYSKKSGYARLTIGQPAQRLLWVDRAVTRLLKAKNADAFLFHQESYSESPNVFVAGNALADAKRVSNTNAFQSNYAWGKQVLMDYTNSRGEKLQMMLTYPADYQPGKKYPMVVYYYEKLSQGFHQYIVPSERAMYNTTVFSQEGYFVLRPDIVFRARDAGFSGLDCVSSAVKAALATGMIDPKRVGNMGHSWGGYQSAFYAVHGKGMFAASIAGAPLTNFISMYGYTSYNTGAPETGHFETGQERMQVSLWEDPQAYIRNSTVFATDKLETPLLLEEGDADGNVNYWQAMELYNFGRRLGKKVIYLIYNGENHGLARPESQADYHRRQIEWFAHYLKGEPAASWITNGETYLVRQKLLRDAENASGAAGGASSTTTTPANGAVRRP
jgi:dipeptidyl aminopeptidase/acylaminoacyl peptidase